MKRSLLLVPMFAFFALVGIGCSTTGHFKLPPNTRLEVTNRTVAPNADGKWETSPFFWAEAGGAKYRLYDADGKLLRSGKLKMHFRPVSIFWPPAAIIYWPIGFEKDAVYDLTGPGDGLLVREDAQGAGETSVMPVQHKKKKK